MGFSPPAQDSLRESFSFLCKTQEKSDPCGSDLPSLGPAVQDQLGSCPVHPKAAWGASPPGHSHSVACCRLPAPQLRAFRPPHGFRCWPGLNLLSLKQPDQTHSNEEDHLFPSLQLLLLHLQMAGMLLRGSGRDTSAASEGVLEPGPAERRKAQPFKSTCRTVPPEGPELRKQEAALPS